MKKHGVVYCCRQYARIYFT